MRSLLYALAVLSLPMRGAWIEIEIPNGEAHGYKSLPMRGAWIEIPFQRIRFIIYNVAPHAGSVD